MLKRIIFFLSLIPSFCFAQKDLPGMSLDVVTDYKPLLADAVKVDVSPKLITADSNKVVPTYNLQTKLLNLPFIPADIHPIAMVKENLEITQNNYLKAGFGTQLSSFASLNLNTGISEKRDAGIFAFHQSGSGSLEYQNFSDNNIEAYYKKILKKTALNIQAEYTNAIRYFYGYNHEVLIDFSKTELKQNFQTVETAITFSNTKPTKALWDYNFSADYYYYCSRTGGNEWHLAPGILIGKTTDKIHIGSLYIGTDINQFNEDSVSSINSIIHIKPSYSIKQDKWNLHVGFDIAPVDSSVYFLPDVEAQYKLIGEYVVPFVGIIGGINKNNFKNLSTENPFVNDISPIAYSSLIDFHGGIKGSIGNHFSFLFRIGDQIIDHLALYNPDTNFVTRYNVSFAEDANVFNVHGELSYKESERLNLLFISDFNSYTLDFNTEAYGLPTQKLSLKAEYNIQKKILINASLYATNKTPYHHTIDSVNTTSYNKGFIDVNLGMIYNYKKNLAAYIQFNNIIANAYQRWFNYPTYGFGVMAGVILKF